MSRVVVLPQRGVLVAATDLHGHLADFRAVVARFLALTTTEAAPHAQIMSAADLDILRLDGYQQTALHEMTDSGPLGALL